MPQTSLQWRGATSHGPHLRLPIRLADPRAATLLFLLPALAVTALPGAAQGSPFRSISGAGNNRDHPEWGRAGVALQRLTTVAYADGHEAPAGPTRRSARAVSNAVCAQDRAMPEPAQTSDFLWQWGQFLDHDLGLTEPADPLEPLPIAVPLGDPFFDPRGTGTAVIAFDRSEHDHFATGPVRQQVNQITAYIDASNVYGSDQVRARALRGLHGFLKTSPGALLPFNVYGLPNAPDPNDPSFFLAGDVRANEQVGLTALHTLFVREHNRLASLLHAIGVGSELTYEVARALVGAEMQAITYNEFLPALLGRGAIAPYRGYRPGVDAGIQNAFSAAAYRLGHSMLSGVLQRLGPNGQPIAAGPIALRDAFFAPQETIAHGIEPVLRGLAAQQHQAIDPFIVDDVRNFLFGPPGAGGFDLAALNIQRGRDHGLPSYNQARIDYGMAPADTFAEVSSDPEVQQRLARAFAAPDDIDLWVGGLAEDRASGSMVGELFLAILRDQFVRLRDGDRYWYQNALPPAFVAYVDSLSLADIVRLNTTIGGELPDDVFRVTAP
ncbi:MAG: peroxidase family protein [Planctomycetota bacterium]